MSVANTGERSTYTFKIPRIDDLANDVSDLFIKLPNNLYDERIGEKISCNIDGVKRTCSVLSDRRIQILNIGEDYIKSPMLSINMDGIIQPKFVGIL